MTVIKEWEKREALSGAWTTLPTLKPPSSAGYRSRISCSFPRLIQSSHSWQIQQDRKEIKTTLSAITVILLITLSCILGQLVCGLFWWYVHHSDWAWQLTCSFFNKRKVHFLTIPFTPSVLTMLTEVHNDLKQLKKITLWLKENVIH